MGRFGKKNVIDLNPLHYNICLLGESGIGKTTIAKEICEKLVGEEGYIHFDIGREEGSLAINGIVSEPIENWEKLTEVVDDIVENKATDYPDLQVVIWDTYDELITLMEAEAVRLHNVQNKDKRVSTINAAHGGFGEGQKVALSLFFDKMWELKSVGVRSFVIGHVKRSDTVDPFTQETYSKITADTQQRYFNALKNKMHFIGLAYIDREIVKEKTGRQNIVTKKDIEINKVVSESRVISFRDDTYSVDSKSRFSNIIDRIEFNPDLFITAMQDAINAECGKSGETMEQAKTRQKAAEEAEKETVKANSVKNTAKKKADALRDECMDIIKSKFVDAEDDIKAKIKVIMAENSIANFKDPESIDLDALEEIANLLK